ncbi:MAG: hypothetical protein ABIG71_01835, partial [Candidatus Uhrbacteria bacterium]
MSTPHLPPARGYAFQEATLFAAERSGALIEELPVTFRDRAFGTSKLGWRDVTEFFAVVLQTRHRFGRLTHDDRIVTWSNLSTSYRRFAILLGVALTVFVGAFTVYAWINTPHGTTYSGLSGLLTGDASVYFSYIEQARDGVFNFRNLFTSEQTSGRMIHIEWYAIGLFARITHLNAPTAFHIVRILLVLPFTLFLAVFVASCIRAPYSGWSADKLRRAALLLGTLGSGVGGLLAIGIFPLFQALNNYALWPIDLWVPEAFTFTSLYQSPHLILSTWLLLAMYLATIRATATGRRVWTAAAAVAAGTLFAFHPFYIPSVLIIVVDAIIRTLRDRAHAWRFLGHAFWVGLAALPAMAYWGTLTILDPVLNNVGAQNTLLMPPLPFVLIGYGFFVPLTIIGTLLLVRLWLRQKERSFLLAWLVVNTFLIWSPFTWQRRFTQGYHVLLAILSAFALAFLSMHARRILKPHRWAYIATTSTAVISFVLLFAFSNIIHISRDLIYL